MHIQINTDFFCSKHNHFKNIKQQNAQENKSDNVQNTITFHEQYIRKLQNITHKLSSYLTMKRILHMHHFKTILSTICSNLVRIMCLNNIILCFI